MRRWCAAIFVAFVALVVYFLMTFDARPHTSPRGWAYPSTCCSNNDCAQAHDDWVTEGPNGYEIKIPVGHHPTVIERPFYELVPYGDKRIKFSKDEYIHPCIGKGYLKSNGEWYQKLICLLVPPNSF